MAYSSLNERTLMSTEGWGKPTGFKKRDELMKLVS